MGIVSSEEVAWRIEAMRRDLRPTLKPGQQFLVARPPAVGRWSDISRCMSCAEPLGLHGGPYRCRACAVAAEHVMNEVYEGVARVGS